MIIREILNTSIIFDKDKFQPIPLNLTLNMEYIIKCDINSKYERLYEIEIYNVSNSENINGTKEQIFRKKFIDSFYEIFIVKDVNPWFEDLCEAYFNIIFLKQQEFEPKVKITVDDIINEFVKKDLRDIINIKLIEINLEQLEMLKINSEKSNQIDDIIDKYFKGNEIDAMREIGVFTEFIAQKLVEKIEKKKIRMDFGAMVNKLCNTSKKEGKYNYNYLGSMMFPSIFLETKFLMEKIQKKILK